MKAKQLFILLFSLPLLWSCETEDNIDDIFTSGTWSIVNFFNTSHWNDASKAEPVYTEAKDIAELKTITISFNKAGAFSGTLSGGGTINGTWQADGKKRTVLFPMNNLKAIGGLSTKDNEFVRLLREAKYYKGDAKNLIIGIDKKTYYVQLSHY